MQSDQPVLGVGMEMAPVRYARQYLRRFPRARYSDIATYLDNEFGWAMKLDSVQLQVSQMLKTARIKN
jgi:hypothetical protein